MERCIKLDDVKEYMTCQNCELDKGRDECHRCRVKIVRGAA